MSSCAKQTRTTATLAAALPTVTYVFMVVAHILQAGKDSTSPQTGLQIQHVTAQSTGACYYSLQYG